MPSYDIASDVDMAEVQNAILMARRELQNRFDFKDTVWEIESGQNQIILSASDEFKLKALDQVLMGKFAKRELPLKNFNHQKIETSSVGRARQQIDIVQGLEQEPARKIVKAIKEMKLKVQAQIQDRQVRVTGKSKDDLQKTMTVVKELDLPVSVTFGNFRN
jgi:uncharacterized protein YajQ (UPF0234 family)